VKAYADSIFDYLRSKEKPIPFYMENQHDISEKMRGILLDWLVDVHLKFQLRTETLYLT
jgi:hypothetical protein